MKRFQIFPQGIFHPSKERGRSAFDLLIVPLATFSSTLPWELRISVGGGGGTKPPSLDVAGELGDSE